MNRPGDDHEGQRSEKLLLVEDTASLALVYRAVLEGAGHAVETARSLAEAIAALQAERFRLVLLDLQLPDGDGLEVFDILKRDSPQTRVIVITADGSIDRAVEAMRAGAFDFLVKPFDERRLAGAVLNALTVRPARGAAVEAPPSEIRTRFHGFLGASPQMQTIYRMVETIGRSTATVFITGESGTGKEVCAQAIHAVSARARGPFVPLNCAAIPPDLLESEVFGHLRGAFTGAIADKEGAAAAAHGGTLFLDEICDMDLGLQTKLLRFLQTSTIQPVGAARPRQVDVRFVCATNRDPAEEVRRGRFREDLFYRLHVVPIHLPPLRERGQDILQIARHTLERLSAEEGKRFVGFDPAVERMLLSYGWPGNVRQLLNVIRNIVVLHDGPVVLPEMIPAEIALQAAAARIPAAPAAEDGGPRLPDREACIAGLVGLPLAEVERALIEATIAQCQGSIPRAAKMLDLSPSTIYRKREAWTSATRRGQGKG